MTATITPLAPVGGHSSPKVTSVAGLALPLIAATQAAALACQPWIGRDDPKAADAAAVAAMRAQLARLPGLARVVIGEGEKDDAPMLFCGEQLGSGDGPAADLAVDPLEGTRLCARAQDGAVSVLAAGPPGSLWATPAWYMEKLVVGAAAASVVSLDQPIEENLAEVAAALDKPVSSLVVGVLDRPRHHALIADVRRVGAAVALFSDGDVMASLRVLLPAGDLDVLVGVGGAPEGVITACAARLLGGTMQGRLAPQTAVERARLSEVGIALEPNGVGAVLTLDALVSSDDCVFAASGVTGGTLLDRPQPAEPGYRTFSFLATAEHPAISLETVS